MIPSFYLRTDLAVEDGNFSSPHRGVAVYEKMQEDIRITTVEILNDDGAKHLNRPIGHYITLDFAPFWKDGEKSNQALIAALSKALSFLLHKTKTPKRILAVGLGNRTITADAVGPLATDQIEVTGHFEEEKALRPYLPPCPTYAISPGVVGNTGIETQKLIKAALSASRASHIIVIDSLAARSTSRLGQCIQLSDSGITPGSGIGNRRAALNRETLGVPVIAIGVPLVVSSSTLVCDALEQAGIQEITASLQEVLENGKSFFVTLNESDLATTLLANTIADAINACVIEIT